MLPVLCRIGLLSLRLPMGTLPLGYKVKPCDLLLEVRYFRKGLNTRVQLHMSPVLISRTLETVTVRTRQKFDDSHEKQVVSVIPCHVGHVVSTK